MVTKGVPCEKRIKDLQKYHEDNADELEKDVEDGWVETANPEKLGAQNNDDGIVDLDSDGDDKPMQVINDNNEEKKEEEDVVDLDDLNSDDENMFAQPAEEVKAGDDNGEVGIKKVRKYDLSITYDFYTQTPRY